MAIRYVDLINGDDSTADGSASLPYKAFSTARNASVSGDEIRLAKTVGGELPCTATFTFGSTTVAVDTDLTGTISVGNYISTDKGGGNGNHDGAYYVQTITATTITMRTKYVGQDYTSPSVKYQKVFNTDSTNAVYISKAGLDVNGGWNLATETRDGETWWRGTSTSNDNYNSLYLSNGSTASYLNPEYCRTGYRIYGEAHHITFGRFWVYAYLYSTSYVHDCFFSYGGSYRLNPNYSTLLYTTNIDNCVFSCYYTGLSIKVHGSLEGKTNRIMCNTSGIGFVGGYDVTNLGNMTIEKCSRGIDIYHSVYGVTCWGAENDQTIIRNCSYGIYMPNEANRQLYFKNLAISNCSYGVRMYRARQLIIEGFKFENNGTDMDCTDAHAGGGNLALNNRHFTPTNYAYKTVANTPPLTIKGCTIDQASILKSLYYPVNASYALAPTFNIQDSFGISSGVYYGALSITYDTSVLSPITNTPTMKFTANTTLGRLYKDYPIASCYVGRGQGKNVSVYYKTDSTWTGEIIPKLKLDSTLIATGGSITSITDEWQVLQISVPDSLITRGGELSFEINVLGGNTAPVYFGDFKASEV